MRGTEYAPFAFDAPAAVMKSGEKISSLPTNIPVKPAVFKAVSNDAAPDIPPVYITARSLLATIAVAESV